MAAICDFSVTAWTYEQGKQSIGKEEGRDALTLSNFFFSKCTTLTSNSLLLSGMLYFNGEYSNIAHCHTFPIISLK